MTRYAKRFRNRGDHDAPPMTVVALSDRPRESRALSRLGWRYVTTREVRKDPALRTASTVNAYEALQWLGKDVD